DVENAPNEDKVRLTVAAVLRALLQTATPHIQFTGDARVDGRLGVGNAPPTTSSSPRAQVSVLPNLGSGTSTLVAIDLSGASSGNAYAVEAYVFTGTYDLNGFNLTNCYELASVPTLLDAVGSGLLSGLPGVRGGIVAGSGGIAMTATDTADFDAITPA